MMTFAEFCDLRLAKRKAEMDRLQRIYDAERAVLAAAKEWGSGTSMNRSRQLASALKALMEAERETT